MDKYKKYDTSYLEKFKPLQVTVRNNDFESAFRTFKSMVQKEKILSLYKEKQTYEKPSVKARRKKREAFERKLMLESKKAQFESGELEKKAREKAKKKAQKNAENV